LIGWFASKENEKVAFVTCLRKEEMSIFIEKMIDYP
jgi:hypothetical protein